MRYFRKLKDLKQRNKAPHRAFSFCLTVVFATVRPSTGRPSTVTT